MKRMDPSDIKIVTDAQRLELARLVFTMETSEVAIVQVYAGRLRALLTLTEAEYET